MPKSKNSIERNRLDYLLTDTMPVEVSELFSYGKLYEYLLSRQNELDQILLEMHQKKANNIEIPFNSGWGKWATKPLKYNILKGTTGSRQVNLVQPLSAMNMYFFNECYQKELLDTLNENSCFSLRFHRKNYDLFYKKRINRISSYFERTSKKIDRSILQQTGAYYRIHKFDSVSSFTSSRLWQQCNFRYRSFGKIDYKACFDSIYTHAYKWCVEKNTVDSKAAANTNLYITLDRILQNINGRSSNGVIIGPEFSRMIAEILLQQIDVEVKRELAENNLFVGKDYRVFRYVDDIFIFSNSDEQTDSIIHTIQSVAQRYLLTLNDLKYYKSDTPVVLNAWLGKTRMLSDKIADLFYSKHEMHEQEKTHLLKDGYISSDRIKADFNFLIEEYPDKCRYIVSFMLSTLLNNISSKKDGYKLLDEKKYGRAFVLLDLAMYIYSYCPCFEHTQKIISMMVYIDDELSFLSNEDHHKKLTNLIRRYSFVLEKGNLNDLCNWFVFFYDYKLSLATKTESIIETTLHKEDNPILWAMYTIYSRYYDKYFEQIKTTVEGIINTKIEQLGKTDIMLQDEFWYALVFVNCPYITSATKTQLTDIFCNLRSVNPISVADKTKNLLCDFMLQNSSNLLFYWGYYHFNTSKQLTFRTYQRTLFKQYKSKRSLEFYGSLDT